MFNLIILLLAAGLTGIDQLIKARVLADAAMVGGQPVEVVPGLFYLTYVENRGAAFGILQNSTGILSAITAVVLIALLWYILSGRSKSRFLTCCIALIIAGGAGNLIDRIGQGFVVDYLDFSALFGFPVFNFADCCVVVGTILLFLGVLWSERKGAAPAETAAEEADNSAESES
jgi:signal peptidase II